MRTFLLLVKGVAEVAAERAHQKGLDVEFVSESSGATILKAEGENETWDALDKWFTEDLNEPVFLPGSLLWFTDEATKSVPP